MSNRHIFDMLKYEECIFMSKFDTNNIGNNLIKVDGKIVFKLKDILDSKNITRYKLSRITNIRYKK